MSELRPLPTREEPTTAQPTPEEREDAWQREAQAFAARAPRPGMNQQCRWCGPARGRTFTILRRADGGDLAWHCANCRRVLPTTAEAAPTPEEQLAATAPRPAAPDPAPIPRDARRALRTAAAALESARAAASRLATSLPTAREAVDARAADHAAAVAALEAARSRAAETVIAGGPPASLAAERAALQEAEDAAEAARAAHERVMADLRLARADLAAAEASNRAAAVAVMAAEATRPLVAHATTLAHDLVSVLDALEWLVSRGAEAPRAREVMALLDRAPRAWPPLPRPGATREALGGTLEALVRSPGAEVVIPEA
jgi:hypothetical protein